MNCIPYFMSWAGMTEVHYMRKGGLKVQQNDQGGQLFAESVNCGQRLSGIPLEGFSCST